MQANSMAPMIHQSVPVETHDQHHLSGLLPAHFRQQIPFEMQANFPAGSSSAAAAAAAAAASLSAAAIGANPLLQRSLHSAAKSDPNIRINLENQELWDEFHKLGTEMIITKLGRRMFPTLKINLSGLDPNAKYYVLMDLVLADDSRFRFSSGWIRSGKAEPQWPSRIYVHPDSPATGAQWMKHEVSFQKVKLTNNTMDQQGHLVLTSMHKYVPRIHVIPASDYASLHWGLPVSVNTAAFPVCSFIAVTAYANERMTQLKIDNNPFAKGFRENGQLRIKKRQLENSTPCVSPGAESGKKSRPESASSSHSSLNITDDEINPSDPLPAAPSPVAYLKTDIDPLPVAAPEVPVATKSPTNFSIARLVGDLSDPSHREARRPFPIDTPPVVFPPISWTAHLPHPHSLHPYAPMFVPRLTSSWPHLPLLAFPPIFNLAAASRDTSPLP